MLKTILIIALLCPVIFLGQENSSNNFDEIILNYKQLSCPEFNSGSFRTGQASQPHFHLIFSEETTSVANITHTTSTSLPYFNIYNEVNVFNINENCANQDEIPHFASLHSK